MGNERKREGRAAGQQQHGRCKFGLGLGLGLVTDGLWWSRAKRYQSTFLHNVLALWFAITQFLCAMMRLGGGGRGQADGIV